MTVRRRTLAAIALLALFAWLAPADAAPAAGTGAGAPDVNRLLARIAAAPGIFARFREEKHMAMLNAPLVNEGTISFAPPSRFVRHTEKPLASTLLIDGNKLSFGDAEGHQDVDLGANPVARLFVDSFVMILTGNRAGLEKLFTMRFERSGKGAGDTAGWKMTLVPRVAPMNKVVKEISLGGEGISIREMELRETSGDWTRTTFSDVDVNRRYTPAEQAKIFRVPGK
jgi:outer membrane lipoprotein-sorting protein